MTFLADLEAFLTESHPEFESARAGEGEILRIAEKGHLDDAETPEIHVQARDGAVHLDWVWRLPVQEGRHEEVCEFLADYAKETFENQGWEVPIILRGGPLNGLTLTKPREDLVGRLLFARKFGRGEEANAADVYKWRLKRNATGEYVCVYERSLGGDDLDAFIARGVEDTGPFVVIKMGS